MHNNDLESFEAPNMNLILCSPNQPCYHKLEHKLKFNFRYLGLPIYWGWLADPDLVLASAATLASQHQLDSNWWCSTINIIVLSTFITTSQHCYVATINSALWSDYRGSGEEGPHSFMFHNKSFSNNDFLSFVVSVNTVYLHIYINNLPASRLWHIAVHEENVW